jgi:CRP/FNR family transcriptional regulator
MPHITGKGHCVSCHIRHLSIFANLSTVQLGEICNFQPTVTTYNAKESIYRQGDASNHAFTLRKGLVKLIKSLPDGRVQIVRILKAGDLFGFDGFAKQDYNQSAVALTDCELCHLPLAGLQELRLSRPEIDKAMMDRWIQHLSEAENMMLDLGAKKASERLASFLVNWGEAERDGWKKMPLSRQEIGNVLGLTIETVSRFLSQWKRAGIIQEQHGNLRIKNKTELCEVINPKGTCQ